MRVQSLIDALEQGTIMAESGGNPNAVHPLVKRGQYAGQRAIGLLGIMPGNVPGWSREHLGREMTPAELAADEEAQKRIFRGEMQKHLAKGLSPQDASSIWFTGRPFAQAKAAGANDSFTGVQDYVAKVTGMGVPTRSVPTTQEGPAAMPMQNPFGGLGGLGGYQPPTGMQTFGDILSALGMSMLSSPSNNMFQSLPTTMTAIQGRRGKEAEASKDAARWQAEFGLRREDLEARRAEQAVDNARQERALKLQEMNSTRSGNSAAYNTTRAMFPQLDPGSQEFLAKYKEVATAGGAGETFGQPTFVLDENGRQKAVRYGSQGSVKEDAVSGSVYKGIEKIDTGTEVIEINRATGERKVTPKNVEDAATAKARGAEVGKAEGTAQIDAPKRLENITKALGELKAIKEHPSREATTGWQANLGLHNWSGTPQQGFKSRVEQATAGAFLEGAQALKGLGQMTEIEGSKATAAINRMNIAQSDAEFMSAVKDYEDALISAQKKIQAMQRGGGKAPPPGFNSPLPRPGPTREEALEELRRRGRI
jgi:hypothetical protein